MNKTSSGRPFMRLSGKLSGLAHGFIFLSSPGSTSGTTPGSTSATTSGSTLKSSAFQTIPGTTFWKSNYISIRLVNLAFIFALMFAGNDTNAQSQSPRAGMPMSLSIVQEGLIMNNAVPLRVNVRALRHFNKSFSGRGALWYDTDNALQARFSDDSIRTVVGYAKQGRWLYTISHYSEKQMPAELRHLVKSEYYDYQIDLVNEVRIPQTKNKIYIIHVKNELKHHKILRFSDEGLQVVKTFHE